MKIYRNQPFIVLLALLYFLTNCAFAHSFETHVWEARRKATNSDKNNSSQWAALPAPQPRMFNLPGLDVPAPEKKSGRNYFENDSLKGLLQFGSIRKVTQPKSPNPKFPAIILIQDIHKNFEAQSNISKAVRALVDQGMVDQVALEGSSGPIDLKAFQIFPDQAAVQKTADTLLAQGKISGPVHALMTSPPKKNTFSFPPLLGVDDPAHHAANVEAYRSAAPHQEDLKKKWADDGRRLEVEKEKSMNPALLAFDRAVTAYRAGAMSLGDYIKILPDCSTSPGRKSGVSTSQYFSGNTGPGKVAARRAVLDQNHSAQLKIFREAFSLESSLDFNRVEAERARLLSQLLPKLSKEASQSFFEKSLWYRKGQMDHTAFHGYLRDLCGKHGIDITPFRAFRDYLRYVSLSERIDAEKLFGEMREVENKTYAALSPTLNEQDLVERGKRQYLTRKLLDFALTREEWDEYKKTKIENGKSKFEVFYEEAEIRDEKMARNILQSLSVIYSSPRRTGGRSPKATRRGELGGVSLLVAGGFHSAGLTQRLVHAGHTVIDFVPKVTKVDREAGPAYLTPFAQEKTPLDKLFEGQKLFLAEPGFSDAVHNRGLVLCVAASVNLSLEYVRIWMWRYWRGGNRALLLAVERTEGAVILTLFFAQRMANVLINLTPGRWGDMDLNVPRNYSRDLKEKVQKLFERTIKNRLASNSDRAMLQEFKQRLVWVAERSLEKSLRGVPLATLEEELDQTFTRIFENATTEQLAMALFDRESEIRAFLETEIDSRLGEKFSHLSSCMKISYGTAKKAGYRRYVWLGPVGRNWERRKALIFAELDAAKPEDLRLLFLAMTDPDHHVALSAANICSGTKTSEVVRAVLENLKNPLLPVGFDPRIEPDFDPDKYLWRARLGGLYAIFLMLEAPVQPVVDTLKEVIHQDIERWDSADERLLHDLYNNNPERPLGFKNANATFLHMLFLAARAGIANNSYSWLVDNLCMEKIAQAVRSSSDEQPDAWVVRYLVRESKLESSPIAPDPWFVQRQNLLADRPDSTPRYSDRLWVKYAQYFNRHLVGPCIEALRPNNGLILEFQNAIQLKSTPGVLKWFPAGVQYGDMAIDFDRMARWPRVFQQLILRGLKNKMWIQLRVRSLVAAPENPSWVFHMGNVVENILATLSVSVPFLTAPDVHMGMMLEAERLLKQAPLPETLLKNAAQLSNLSQMDVKVKMENTHPVGSFKARVSAQVFRWFAMMTPEERREVKEIVVESTGNQGMAVGWAIQQLKRLYPEDTSQLKGVVYAAAGVPIEKQKKMNFYGMELRQDRRMDGERVPLKDYGDAHDEVLAYKKKMGTAVLHVQHGSWWVMAGYSTAALEIIRELRSQGKSEEPTLVFVPVGSGGLYGAIWSAFRSLTWSAWFRGEFLRFRVIPVETTQVKPMLMALLAGEPVGDNLPENPDEDGISVKEVEPLPLKILKRNKETLLTVDKPQYHEGTRLTRADVGDYSSIEYSAGLPAAALLTYGKALKEAGFKRAILIATGGNIDKNNPGHPAENIVPEIPTPQAGNSADHSGDFLLPPSSLLYLFLMLPPLYNRIKHGLTFLSPRLGRHTLSILKWVGFLSVPLEGILFLSQMDGGGPAWIILCCFIFLLAHIYLEDYGPFNKEAVADVFIYHVIVALLYATIHPFWITSPSAMGFALVPHLISDAVRLWSGPWARLADSSANNDKIGLLFRTMKENDLEQVVGIEPDAKDGWNHLHWDRQRFLKKIRLKSNGACESIGLIAQKNGVTIGYVVYHKEDDRLVITNIAVRPDFQKQNLGRKLIENIRDTYKAAEYPYLVSYVDTRHGDANAFFHKLKFMSLIVHQEENINCWVQTPEGFTGEDFEGLSDDIRPRDEQRIHFFHLLEYLNREPLWWIREEKEEGEKIVNQGLYDKTELDFYGDEPNLPAIIGWSPSEFELNKRRLRTILQRQFKEINEGKRNSLSLETIQAMKELATPLELENIVESGVARKNGGRPSGPSFMSIFTLISLGLFTGMSATHGGISRGNVGEKLPRVSSLNIGSLNGQINGKSHWRAPVPTNRAEFHSTKQFFPQDVSRQNDVSFSRNGMELLAPRRRAVLSKA
ncbi:MAG: hypothetical protein KCHDKBKB_01699 [Elusimicrobia bacterium]|nr:hypothetical protein [Elusimicrobiota bacterium]